MGEVWALLLLSPSSSSTPILCSGSADRTILCYDALTGDVRHKLEGHADSVFCLESTSNGTLVSGSWDSSVMFWDAESGTFLREIRVHDDAVWRMGWDDSGHLFTGSWDSSVGCVDVENGVCISRLVADTLSSVTCLQVQNQLVYVTGQRNLGIKVWDPRTKCEGPFNQEFHTNDVPARFSVHNHLIAWSSTLGGLSLLDTRKGSECLRELLPARESSYNEQILALELAGRWCVGAGHDGKVRLWELNL
eukprot:c12754_g1_i2.p1 GENE.c12754_g1_i2~~c12754_g1_i2.p1  ORF type:complete len:249 (+),score=42.76 c12754_g1_i2:719-1465(+)